MMLTVLTVAQDSMAVTTDMQMNFYYVIFAICVAITGISYFSRRNLHAIVMSMVATLVFIYIAMSMVSANDSFMIISVIFAIISGLGMIISLYSYMNAKKTWVVD